MVRDLSVNAFMVLYADIRSNIETPRRVALVRIFKEAGLRSPRTQLTKVQIAISVGGRRTEAIATPPTNVLQNKRAKRQGHLDQSIRASRSITFFMQ